MNATRILSHTESHLAAHLIMDEIDGERVYLVFEYDSGKGVQVKFPAGTNNDHPGEEILLTLDRETHEETGLTSRNPQLVHKDERSRGHVKFFFISHFRECDGELRKEERVDDDGDRQSPPFWRTAKELMVDPKDGGLFYTHRKALEEAEKVSV